MLIILPPPTTIGKDTLPQSSLTKLKGAANVYTFRDFILLPGRSELEPREIDLATRLTGKIKLSIPVISSPMDTVTEWKMAVALARVGGVGVVHRNMTIEDQVSNLRKVKNAKIEPKSADEAGKPLVGASVSPLDPKRCWAGGSGAGFLVCDVGPFHNSNGIKAAAKVLPYLSGDFILVYVGAQDSVLDIFSELS